MTDTEEKKKARLDPVLEDSWAHKKGVFFRKEEFYLKPEMTKNGDAEKENGFYEIAKRFLKVNGCEPELVDAPKGFESQGISKGDKVWVIRGAEKIQKLKALFEKAKTNEDFRSLPQKESISGEPYPTNNDTIKILNGDYDNLDTLKKLIEKGGNPLFYNSSFGSALFHVPNVECAKFLLEQGVPLDCEYNGTTALFTARDKEVAKFLIERGLSAQKKDISGRTALFTVENLEVAKYLVEEKGLNPKETDMFGRTALFTARNSDIVNYLVKEKGVDVNHLDNDGQNALFHSYFRIGDELIKNGINVNQLDKKGKNVLFYTYSKASAQRLIKAGVKYKGITAQDAEKVEDIPGVKKALEDPDFQSVLEDLEKNAQQSTSTETPGEKSETREETTDHEKIKDEYRKKIQELKDEKDNLTPDQYEQAKKDLEEWRKEQSIKDNLPTVEEALNPKITVSKAPSAQMEQDKNRTNGAAPSPGEKEPMSTSTETSDNSSPEDDKKKTNTGDEPERSNGDKPKSKSTNGESERNGENQEGHGSGSGTPPNSNPPTSGGDDEEDGNDEDHPISDGNKQENPGISDEDDEEEEEEERDEEDEEEEEGDEKKNNEHEDSPVTRIASKETEKKKERFSDATKEAVDNFFKGTFEKDHKTAEDFAGDFLYNLLALPLDFASIYLTKNYSPSEKDLLKEILEEMRKNKENEGNGEHGEKGGPAPWGSDEYTNRVISNLKVMMGAMAETNPELYQFLNNKIGNIEKGEIRDVLNSNVNIKNQFTAFITEFAKTEGGQKILIEMFPDDYRGEHSPAALIALLSGENREDVDVKGSRINIHNINNNNNGSNGNGGQSETVTKLLDIVEKFGASKDETMKALIQSLNSQNEKFQKLIDEMDQRRAATETERAALEKERQALERARIGAQRATEQKRLELEREIREREAALREKEIALEKTRMQHEKEMVKLRAAHDRELVKTITENISAVSDKAAEQFAKAVEGFKEVAKEQLGAVKEQSKGLTEAQKELSKAIAEAAIANGKAADANKEAATTNGKAADANEARAEADKARAEADKANGAVFTNAINLLVQGQEEAAQKQAKQFAEMFGKFSEENKAFLKDNREFFQAFTEKMMKGNAEIVGSLKEAIATFKGGNSADAVQKVVNKFIELEKFREQQKTNQQKDNNATKVKLAKLRNENPQQKRSRGGETPSKKQEGPKIVVNASDNVIISTGSGDIDATGAEKDKGTKGTASGKGTDTPQPPATDSSTEEEKIPFDLPSNTPDKVKEAILKQYNNILNSEGTAEEKAKKISKFLNKMDNLKPEIEKVTKAYNLITEHKDLLDQMTDKIGRFNQSLFNKVNKTLPPDKQLDANIVKLAMGLRKRLEKGSRDGDPKNYSKGNGIDR